METNTSHNMNYDRIEQLISCMSLCASIMQGYSYNDFTLRLPTAQAKIKAAARLSAWCGKKILEEYGQATHD